MKGLRTIEGDIIDKVANKFAPTNKDRNSLCIVRYNTCLLCNILIRMEHGYSAIGISRKNKRLVSRCTFGTLYLPASRSFHQALLSLSHSMYAPSVVVFSGSRYAAQHH